MTVRKIITLAACPLKETMSHVVRLQSLLQAGIDVAAWNVCGALYGRFIPQGASACPEREKNIMSLLELEAAVADEDLDQTLFLAFVGHEIASKDLFCHLRDKRAVTGYLDNMTWYFYEDIPRWRRLWLRAHYLGPFLAFLREKLLRCRLANDTAGYDVVFYDAAIRKPQGCCLAVPVNSVLYEEALFDPVPSPFHGGSYAVYLDTAMGSHPDVLQFNVDQIPGAEYRTSLLRFFDKLERDLGLKVVIAAHPKAQYQGDEFAGRPIFRQQTCALVRGAQLVLSDGSTSTLYAVALHKPIIFILNDCLLRWSHAVGGLNPAYGAYSQILSLRAQSLGMPLLNIDRCGPAPLRLPQVDKTVYQRECFKWLTHPGMEHIRSEKVFLETLQQMDIRQLRRPVSCKP